MSFAEQLRAAKGDLTARQVAEAIENAVSIRTIEDWLAGRHTPHKWQQKITLAKLAKLTGKPPDVTWDGCETAADVEEYLAQENLGKPKRSRKGTNAPMTITQALPFVSYEDFCARPPGQKRQRLP